MSSEVPAGTISANSRRFLASFMTLAVLSGITIGTGRVVTTFYALSIHATSAQIGFIAAAEAFGKMIVTLPAGFLIYRFGARRVYSTATFGSMALSLAVPFMGLWYGVAVMRALVSLCVPFRVVSMNTSFLQRLPDIGSDKAGWYRGAMQLGVAFLGPTLGGLMVTHTNYWVCYGFISACFAAMALFSRTFLPEQLHEEQRERSSLGADLMSMLRDRRIAETCCIEFMSSATSMLFTTFIIVLAVTAAGLSSREAIFLVTMQGITSVVALFILGPMLRARAGKLVYVTAIPAGVVSLALLGLSHSIYWLSLAAVLLSFSTALVHLSNVIALSEASFSKSKVSGLYNLAGMLGGFFGAAVGAVFSATLGLQGLFLAWIPVVVLAVLGCAASRRRDSFNRLDAVSNEQ